MTDQLRQVEITYCVLDEILPERGRPEVAINVTEVAVGRSHEFVVAEYDLTRSYAGKPLRVSVFAEAFSVFALIPEFFNRLGRDQIETLHELYALLADLGAVDKTPKLPNGANRRDRLRVLITSGIARQVESVGTTTPEAIADVVRDALGEKADD
jgi:hypothetical protein